jgi:hypothetical protein
MERTLEIFGAFESSVAVYEKDIEECKVAIMSYIKANDIDIW